MITARGWWFLLVVVGLLSVSVCAGLPVLGVVTLTLLVWFLASLLLFQVRLRLQHGQLVLEREVRDERGPVQSLWQEMSFVVQVQLHNDGVLPTLYLRLVDRVPFGVTKIAGESEIDGTTRPGFPLSLKYHIHCTAPGQARFEGVALHVADLQGFFYARQFLRLPQVYRVLPALADVQGHIPTVKRHNLLPSLGSHRHRRAGSGSELLDLRDYLPGDPPKTIAWKVTARRDRLITKVFESEVPLRCTFFVDTSQSVRVGATGDNALARLVEITASLCQATAGRRDLPGVCLFDEASVTTYLRPARSPRHIVQIMNRLAEAAMLQPASVEVSVESVLPLAYSVAEELYPDLLNRHVNHCPWWLYFWSPRSPATMRLRPLRSRSSREWLWPMLRRGLRASWLWFRQYILYRVLLPVMLLLYWSLPISILIWLLLSQRQPFLPRRLFEIDFLFPALLLLLLYWSLPVWIMILARRTFLFRWFLDERAHYRWRKQLAALLSMRYELGPGGTASLLENEEQLVAYMQRFLAEHQVPYVPPFYGLQGEYLFAAPDKIEVLSRALLHAVARGKDNELFVLLVDLLELEDQLEPLLHAIKVALARHHQVMIVCPWPPGLAVPDPKRQEELEARLLGAPVSDVAELRRLLMQMTALRMQRAYGRLRRTFGKVGVSVLCAAQQDSVQLILNRLERLRRQGWRVR
jgi:uncharacterized protein (DUF58 family)